MATPRADETDVHEAEEFLATREGLKHIRIRKRADLLILDSGPSDDPPLHARLRRETVQYCRLEMPSHERWERTRIRGTEEQVLTTLVEQFGWTLAPIADYPARISDRSY